MVKRKWINDQLKDAKQKHDIKQRISIIPRINTIYLFRNQEARDSLEAEEAWNLKKPGS